MSQPLQHYKRLFGLIGYPLSHSFSKRYFTEKFAKAGITDAHYELFPLQSVEELPGLLEAYPNIVGLNVTIPYKQAVLPYLDSLDESAAAVGAVNTIRRSSSGLIGYNTDVVGFEADLLSFLQKAGAEPDGLQALVLGTGGAAKAVAYVLGKLGIGYTYVSRSAEAGQLAYEALSADVLRRCRLIINTTPLGMAPETERSPNLPYEALMSEHLLYDLVYNPAQTQFMQRGQAQGASTANGLGMLHGQAEKAWEIWQA